MTPSSAQQPVLVPPRSQPISITTWSSASASAIGFELISKECFSVCLCAHVCQSVTTWQKLHWHLHKGDCAPLLSPVVWTAIKLSESYSFPTLNEAHLQEQKVPSHVLVHGPYTEAPPRGPSLMRNSSDEISSIPFGTDMRPKLWSFCIYLFRLCLWTPSSQSRVHLKPPKNHLKLQTQ